MFKEEVYAPFWGFLADFEREVNPAQLPVKLSSMEQEDLLKTTGEYHAKISEIELLCQQADKHSYTPHPGFTEQFRNISLKLGVCCDKILTSDTPSDADLRILARTYKELVEELRSCLSKCRRGLH